MHQTKRNIILTSIAAAAMALCLATVPPAVAAAAPQPQAQSQPAQAAQTFNGNIAKDQSGQYVLQDGSNAYHLTEQQQVGQYDGKKVKITGVLDQQSKTIKVSKIEAAS